MGLSHLDAGLGELRRVHRRRHLVGGLVADAPGDEGPPQALVRAAAKWCAASGILAVLLGLKAAIFHAAAEELLWAAAAIASPPLLARDGGVAA